MIGKMMKTVLNRLRRDETGQALILALIMLLLGGLIMAPLLGFMGTGLKAGQAYEQRMSELYAADAGIEDAILKIMNGLAPIEYGLTVNGKDVWVQIPPEDGDAMLEFFINLGILRDTQGNYNKARPHQDWLVVYAPLVDEEGMCYEYRITAMYVAGGQPRLSSTGFWIYRYDDEQYQPGTATVLPWEEGEDNHRKMDLNNDGLFELIDLNDDGEMDVNENDIPTEPLIDPGYTNCEYRIVDDGVGRAFIWEWQNQGPRLGHGVICRTQRFLLDKPILLSEFPINVAWIGTDPNSIQISWQGEIADMEGIAVEATSPATGKSTTVTSYVFAEKIPGEPVAITIMTWEIDLQ